MDYLDNFTYQLLYWFPVIMIMFVFAIWSTKGFIWFIKKIFDLK